MTGSVFGLPSDQGGKDLGVFLPIANGGWILSSTAPKLDGSYEYNRRVAQLAEETGLDFIMSMAKWRGYGGHTDHWRYSLDSQILMSALAAQTSRVKVWTTVHSLLQNPAVTAKMIATLDHVSGGRAGLNVVTGSYKGEFEQMRAWRDTVDHDQRYDLAEEWVTILKRLWDEDSVSFQGRYFTMEDCQSDPKPVNRPFLICAGTSERGMRFTATQMDAIFCSGRDDAELHHISSGAKKLARDAGHTLRTYTMLTLLIGETDEAARAQEEHIRSGFDVEACRGMMRAYGLLDSEIGRENAFTESARSTFMTPRVVGSPDSVAARLIELIEGCELDGLMLVFPDYLASMPAFATEIMPKIRSRFP
jgi:pyrimidine oxygenase